MKTIKLWYSAIILGIVAMGFSEPLWAQNFSSDYLKCCKEESFSVVTVNSSMIESLKKKEKDPKLMEFFNEVNFLRVITVTQNVSSHCNYVRDMVKKYDYEELLSIDKRNQKVVILADKTQPNKAKEIILVTCELNSLTIVDITGDISLDKLKHLSSAVKKVYE